MSQRQIDLAIPVEQFLNDVFEQNYEAIRLEEGRALAPDVKETARQQVMLYWQKLQDVAMTITDTEVRLTLPNQTSPKERHFAIDGIVDIVREEGYTVMYDIKSLDAAYVRDHAEWFECQLNVYAHIWQNLRGEALQQTAVIATAFPRNVEQALESGDPGQLAWALGQWSPIVPMTFDERRVSDTIADFGRIVDAIEDGEFAPRPLDDLQERMAEERQRFATAICRNCDARFSCSSYRAWSAGASRRSAPLMQDYFIDDDLWAESNLEATPDVDGLRKDFVER